MKALRALVLLALIAWTAANWFYREPVRRTISPVHATSRIPLSEHLPEKARDALGPCLGDVPPPMTMESLVSLARERSGVLMRETLERRLVRFLDGEGRLRYLTYRAEPAPDGGERLSLRVFALVPGEAPAELPLSADQRAQAPAEAMASLLSGATLLSDVERTRFRGAGLRSWSLETENGSPREVRFEEPGISFECSSAHGPATCSCTPGA